jgi:hypothetical protein
MKVGKVEGWSSPIYCDKDKHKIYSSFLSFGGISWFCLLLLLTMVSQLFFGHPFPLIISLGTRQSQVEFLISPSHAEWLRGGRDLQQASETSVGTTRKRGPILMGVAKLEEGGFLLVAIFAVTRDDSPEDEVDIGWGKLSK